MYNIIPLILILISLGIVIFIVVKKFSVLAAMDVDNIPAEKEAIVKERIISNRLKRNIFKWSSKGGKVFRFFGDKIGILAQIFYKKLHELKDSYKTEVILATGDKEKKIEELSAQAKEMIGDEEIKEAERKLIEIIGLDSQNIEAFKSLGDLYLENKNYEEAKQTFKHILKLMKDSEEVAEIGEINFNLALANKAAGNLAESLADIKEALKYAPSNPRYLDTMLEISIIKKDKIFALDALKKLERANPDNQKLEDFREQIKEL
ncbi:MAG: tetratricopeptide repeat protein [Patescibacteria group bacterium]